MGRTTFLLLAALYYFVSIAIVGVVLYILKKNNKKKIKQEIEKLETEKNLVISASMLSELNKVETLVNNDELRQKYKEWQDRFKKIKDKDLPKITDALNEIDELFEENNFEELKKLLLKTEYDLNALKTKADFLLAEIKELTLSESKNREIITKLKAEYREIASTYHENEEDYAIVKVPVELQFENVDKLFGAFENAMDQNAYTEVGKIVKAISDIIENLKVVIAETKPVVLLGKSLIPQKMEDIKNIATKMEKEGYNLEYLNIEYNITEAGKKIQDIFQRLNVLNLEDSLFELRTTL